jgi:hypothetical protein
VAGFFLGKPANAILAERAMNSNSSANANAAARTPTSAADRHAALSSKEVSNWDNRWNTALGRPNNPARTRELSALIEELAHTDHERALALAAANDNWRIRDILRSAALRGWASTAPDAAGDFALTMRIEDRRAAVAAVLQGTSASPEETVRLALRLCEADPAPAGDYGHAAIAALVDSGAFAEAVKFGEQIGTEKFPYLWKSAFFQWSRNQPAEALAACKEIEDPALRARARGEVVSGWAWADPKGLAESALKLPDEDRKEALTEALPLWMEREPEAAINWLNSHDRGPGYDAGLAAAANLQNFVVNQPDTAMNLAGDISDNALRTQTLRAVFRQWALADLAAARSFAANRKGAADRALLEAEIEDLVPAP